MSLLSSYLLHYCRKASSATVILKFLLVLILPLLKYLHKPSVKKKQLPSEKLSIGLNSHHIFTITFLKMRLICS